MKGTALYLITKTSKKFYGVYLEIFIHLVILDL